MQIETLYLMHLASGARVTADSRSSTVERVFLRALSSKEFTMPQNINNLATTNTLTFIEAPDPLLRPVPAAEELPLEDLGPLREPVEAIAQITSAPAEIAFQSILATAALSTQHLADVETLAGSAPLSLFLLTVASSGERKSTCDELAIKPILDWEEAEHAGYLKAKAAYDADLERFEATRKKALQAEDVIDGALPDAPIPPVVPRKLLSDITFEGVLRHFDEGDPSVGIFADEGGQFFGGHGMSRDNALKTAAGLSKIWDAAPLNRTRAGMPQTTHRHRRGSLHLMIQPQIAASVLSNAMLRDQGLLSRTLIAWPQSRIGKRLITISPDAAVKTAKAQNALAQFHAKINKRLARAAQIGRAALELRPPTLPLSREARNLLILFANEVEQDQEPGSALAEITGFASKAAEQAARIAGVLTVLEDPDTDVVDLQAMEWGVGITAWYISEAQRLMVGSTVDPQLEKAQLLLQWLGRKYPGRPFNAREITRFGPSSIRDSKTAHALIRILHQHRYIRPVPGDVYINASKTKEAWELVQ